MDRSGSPRRNHAFTGIETTAVTTRIFSLAETSFKSLGTAKWARALATHSRRQAAITEQRASGGVPQSQDNLRTLGDG